MSAVKAFLGAVNSVTTQLDHSIVLAKVDIKILSWTTESALVWNMSDVMTVGCQVSVLRVCELLTAI